MGAVYLARQLTLDRDVALKILSPALSGAPALVARFMREAYAAGQITHHNVVQVYDFGKKDADGTAAAHFFSMELVDGGLAAGTPRRRRAGRPRGRRSASRCRRPAGWRSRTGTASFTATSSPTT